MTGRGALAVNDVRKRFGRLDVLRGASVRIERGEVVGVVGENGAGKSTLLRIIVGLLAADGGTIQISGRYGYCPQEPQLFDGLTIEQNLAYFSAAYGLSLADGKRRGGELMERLGFARHGGRPVQHLSGGTRQKLNLAIALLHEPDLLVLDEPYQGFDYESYLAFWELAAELGAAGRSTLVVSHLVHDRTRLHRLYRMVDGRTAHD